MPSFFVNQPNGNLARFSTVVDDFTHLDMNHLDAYILARRDLGEREAKEKVENGIDDAWPCSAYDETAPAGLRRWTAAIATVRAVHGVAAAGRRLEYFFAEYE